MKKDLSRKDKFLDEFITKCKASGLKITPQRIAIYEEVLNSFNHPSTEAIYRKIKDAHPNISFDTVNRTLLTFAEIGIIQIVAGSGDVRRFDTNVEQHHHLQCTNCGEIIDFYNENYNNLEVPKELPEKFTVNKIRVILEGFCNNCQESSEKKSFHQDM